jgi:ankyrin repeat protein
MGKSIHDAVSLAEIERKKNDINKQNQYGNTLLHRAAYNHQNDMVRHLLNIGSNPNLLDKTGWSALHYACVKPETENSILIVKELINARAELNPKYRSSSFFSNIESPLHKSIKAGNSRISDFLIEHGASLSAPDQYGYLPYELKRLSL